MPVWHERTIDLQRRGELAVAGIVQEQHPERAALFMQWKQMDWPILVDALDLLEVAVVPVHLLIDEAGVVRAINPDEDELAAFIARTAPELANLFPMLPVPPDFDGLRAAAERDDADAKRAYADALVMRGDDASLDAAIAAYEAAVALEPGHGPTHFRLGVAFRRRFESPDHRRDGDFSRAVEHWSAALGIDPNQYIWRRRIQQYGPRLDKPYSFYDWVETAREAIRERGDEPVSLPVEPSGAEFARPQRSFVSADAGAEPDRDRRIDRDEKGLVDVETTVVQHTTARRAYRVHAVLRPSAARGAHWNNEADVSTVWIDPPDGWTVDERLHRLPMSKEPVSDEPRRVEFELSAPDDAAAGPALVSAYALVYVCEGRDGACLYRRHEFTVTVD